MRHLLVGQKSGHATTGFSAQQSQIKQSAGAAVSAEVQGPLPSTHDPWRSSFPGRWMSDMPDFPPSGPGHSELLQTTLQSLLTAPSIGCSSCDCWLLLGQQESFFYILCLFLQASKLLEGFTGFDQAYPNKLLYN